jgi:hypothetical protein
MNRQCFVVLAFAGAIAGRALVAAEWLSIEAEQFQKVEAQCRNFGGVVGVTFPKKESVIRTAFELPRQAQACVWARVYFPWSGQDSLALGLDDQTFTLSATSAYGGGRWEVGNYQVWHWVRAGTANLQAGRHTLALGPAKGAGQRVDRVVIDWGTLPEWGQPWLCGDDVAGPGAQWDRGNSLAIPAIQCAEVAGDVESLANGKVVVLRHQHDRLRTTFRLSDARQCRVWVRVWFEAKNMFEGLTMQEMANNFYISLDGELVKMVPQQNARQWHWVAVDGPHELKPGTHLVTLTAHGLPVKVDQIVLHSGEDATQEPWFHSPPSGLPLGIAGTAEVARAGNWRAHAAARQPAMTFLGQREGPAQFPVKVQFGADPAVVDFVRVVGQADNSVRGDRTPCQQICLWMHNSGQALRVEVLYSDRHGECFLQPLHADAPWTGWRLLTANVPLRVDGDETFFDNTGESADSVATPAVGAQVGPGRTGESGTLKTCPTRCAGGDRNAVPDFPLEVRAIRIVKPAGKAEVMFGDPWLDSPLALRARLVGQTESEVAFEIEVQNRSDTERTGEIGYRFADDLGDPLNDAARRAMLQRREITVPGRGKAALRVAFPAAAGIRFLECRVGPDAPLRRYVATGDVWKQQLAGMLGQREKKAGAYRFFPGADRPLKKADGTPLRAEDLPAAYGADKGLVVSDDGFDVCSLAYAAKRDFAYPLRAQGCDLSDEAGWPNVPVPNGVLAIDPALGRFKFAEADPTRLALRSVVQTGFGVPGPAVTVRGRFAYVGPGEGHYSIVDCADKTRPRVVGHISSWYFSYRLLPFRNYAYFEPSHRGLVLVDDLSNPTVPGPLRSVQFNRGRHGRLVHVVEDEAVGYSVGGEKPALWAFDLSDPLYPREITKVDGVEALFPCAHHALAQVGDTVQLLDLSSPRKPKLVAGQLSRRELVKDGKTEKTELAAVFAVSPEHLALRVRQRIDVYRYAPASVFAPEKIVSLAIPEKSGPHVFGAFCRGLLYVLDGKEGPGQYSLGANSPASRWFVVELGKGQQVGRYEHPWPSAFGNITIVGDTAYVADYNYGLWIFDLADPRNPKRLGGAVTAGESDALWLDGDRAYQWQTFGGAVFLLDIADPGAPRRLGEYWDGAWLPYGNSRRSNNTVAGKDGFLYVPRQNRGLLAVDVRDPARPQQVAEFQDEQQKPLLQAGGACIDVWGDRAAVIAAKRLLMFDVSRAGQPRLLSTLAIPEADLVAMKAERVFVGHAKGGLSIIDVANPAKPALLSTLDLVPYCPVKMGEVISGLAVAKGHVYLTARSPRSQGANYLHVVDVRDPKKPRWVKTYQPKPDLPESPCSLWADFYQDLVADGDYLFIGDYGEIQCLDISAPESPRFADGLHVGYQWSVGRKRGPHLYVPALSGLLVLRAPSSSQAPVGKVEAKSR